MTTQEMQRRTKRFGLRAIKVVQALSQNDVGGVLGRVEEECDESLYWLEVLVEADLLSKSRLESLTEEANEIISMTVAAIKTIRSASLHRPPTAASIRAISGGRKSSLVNRLS